MEYEIKRLPGEVPAEVHFNGRQTIAMLTVNGNTFVGTATCMKGDKYSKEIGEGIALSRAAKVAAKYEENLWISRAVTKEDWAKKHNKRIAR